MVKRHRQSINNSDRVEYKTTLGSSDKYKKVKSKKKNVKKITKLALILVAVAVLFYLGKIGLSFISAADNILPTSISLKDLVSKSDLDQTDGITNILLLGRDQAAQLTDSIEVVRIRQSDKKIIMVSIPRDLQVTASGSTEKINAVFSQGYNAEKDKTKKVSAGAALAAKTVEGVTGLDMHYYITVDFAGLKDVVDALGGIEVNVENSFTDYQYPKDYFTKDGQYVKTDGYETFSVKAGVQEMDGTTALKYSRSRHGNNGEGSDFARAARQQKVLMAIKDKTLSLGFLTNPIKITDMMDSLGTHIKTDMEFTEIKELASLLSDVNSSDVTTKVLSTDSSDGLLMSVSEGAYYIKPKAGNFSQVQKFFKSLFDEGLSQASIEVEIYNGSGVAGQGTSLAKVLEADGIGVSTIETNSEVIAKTVVYDGSDGSSVLTKIKSKLENPTVEDYNQPGIIKIIVGKDYGK